MRIPATILFLGFALGAHALEVPMQAISADGSSTPIGTITLTDSKFGVLITPALGSLPPGLHGFHLHEMASCAPGPKDGKTMAGMGAGPHYDPEHSGKHEGPYGNGHLGDLPPLFVDSSGHATLPVVAPRLRLSDFAGHSLMIHAGGDNLTDQPALGGGGARIACGVVGS
jgi:Cu-Zn family superoxide dismutase